MKRRRLIRRRDGIRQHYTVGRRRKTRFRTTDYKFANASINRKLEWLTRLSRQQERLADKISTPGIPAWKRDALKDQISLINRDKDDIENDIRKLNNMYFPKNPRKLKW